MRARPITTWMGSTIPRDRSLTLETRMGIISLMLLFMRITARGRLLGRRGGWRGEDSIAEALLTGGGIRYTGRYFRS